MSNPAWKSGGDLAPQADSDRRRAPLARGVRPPPIHPSPLYSVVIALCGVAHAIDVIRDIVRLHRGVLEWLSGNQPRHATRMHLRVRAERIYDIVTAFEGAGFDVVRVVATGR